METKFNFKSQPCTSREQSERLLALGLKKETADCYLFEYDKEKYKVIAESWLDLIADAKYYSQYKDVCFPAWSLGRLIEDLIPEYIVLSGQGHCISIREHCVKYVLDGYESNYMGVWSGYTLYDKLINCIEWLIKEGNFNKEYLYNEMEEKA